jgi:hypothetical protein
LRQHETVKQALVDTETEKKALIEGHRRLKEKKALIEEHQGPKSAW